MKRRKVIGITLMAASILLQVGYATTVGQNIHTVNTEVFKVEFEEELSIKHDAYIDVTAEVGKGLVNINVGNLYPGGKFKVTPIIKNSGELDATITKVEFIEKQGEGYSHELFESLVGYSKGQTVTDYSTYLKDTYLGQVIEADTTLAIPVELGLDPEETGHQNEKIEFALVLQFEQEEVGSSGGESGDDGGDYNPPTDTEEADKDTDTEIPDVDTPEEIFNPNEDNTPAEEPIPDGEIFMPEEDIEVIDKQSPKGSVLPKTGGITPVLVYGLGMVLLGGGFIIYRKKDE